MADVLFMHAGNQAEWSIPITNADGSAKSLVGATDLTFMVKRRIDDADTDAVISMTPVVSDAAGGIIDVRLTPAHSENIDPGWYVWALQFTDGTGKSWEFPAPSSEPGKLLVRRSIVAVPA